MPNNTHIVFHDIEQDNYVGIFPLPPGKVAITRNVDGSNPQAKRHLSRCWDECPKECQLPWEDKPKPVEIIEVTKYFIVPRDYPQWVERYNAH